jgi:alpha-glucosidase
MRSLAINYTHDNNVYNTAFDDQYLFGSAFLVAPFAGGDAYGKVYFPAGKWYDLYNDEVQTGGQSKILELSSHKLPVFVKESSIVPMQSLVQSTAEQPTDTLFVHIYKGSINNTFVYYEDDGQSYDYENGAFYKRTINYNAAQSEITFNKVEGSLPSKFHNIKLVLHGFDGSSAIKLNGKQVGLSNDFNAFINPVSRFDPQGTSNPVEGQKVKSIVFKNGNDKISISY